MTLTRRNTLKTLVAISGTGLLHAARTNASTGLTLGLIFPPYGRGVPDEGLAMYGGQVNFLVEGLGLATLTPAGYDQVIDRIGPAANALAEQGAQAITLMGTSLSFYQGQAFNAKLTAIMRAESGLPAVTMSTAVIEGLRTVGAKRVAAATAYNEEVNGRLRSFLTGHGFEVVAVTGMGIEKIEDVERVTQPQLTDFAAQVFAQADGADALLVSCGGLRTLEILAPLEARCEVPAVSSTPHALRAGVRLLGLSGQAPGYGTLLDMG